MFKYILTAISAAALLSVPAKADGLFMGVNWARSAPTSQNTALPAASDPQVRAEDNDGIRAYKLNKVSVQAYAKPYAGNNVPDGICDQLQPKAGMNDGEMAYLNAQAVHTFYNGPACASIYYPGFAFFWGAPNMALAPHWDGTPDFVPVYQNYMDRLDPRYNPALRYGG